MNKNALIVVSNHPADKWSPEQKSGWDVIDYIPFPNVNPNLSLEEVRDQIAKPLITEIADLYRSYVEKGYRTLISIQGEFTLTAVLITELFLRFGYCFTFPTTERVVSEVTKPDGSVEKTATFKFVRWR